jgi:hypothetical protein
VGDDGWGRAVSGWGRERESLTGGVQVSVGEERERRYPFGFSPARPWASFRAGPDWSPLPFIPFYFFFLFLFLFFLFLPYNLKKCFKTIQTTFNFFVKFKIVI